MEKTRKELAIEILDIWKALYAATNTDPIDDEYNTELRDAGNNLYPLKEDGKIQDFYTEELKLASKAIKEDKSFGIKESLISYILAFASGECIEKNRFFIRPKRDLFLKQFHLYDILLDISCSPRAKWPSKFSPSFMQQLAINLFTNKKTNLWPRTIPVGEDTGERIRSSIFSVNGPPGTGKTTLLKEIIASNIVKKALIMVSLKTPNDMFSTTFNNIVCLHEWTIERTITYIDKYGTLCFRKYPYRCHEDGKVTFYCPRDDLVALGITVASNNNKAVENISLELPVDGYISQLIKDGSGEKKPPFDFLASYLSSYYEKNEGKEKYEKIKEKIWGLVSLCLGNSGNMRAVMGDIILPLIENNDPHNTSYTDERKRFVQQYNKVKNLASEIKTVADAYKAYNTLEYEYQQKYGQFEDSLMDDINRRIEHLEKEVEEGMKTATVHNSAYLSLKNSSGITWFSMLFAAGKTRKKVDKINEEKRQRDEIISKYTELKNELSELRATKKKAIDYTAKIESYKDKSGVAGGKTSDKEMTYLSREYVLALSSDDLNIQREAHIANPWMTREYDKEREKLFLYALEFSMKFCLASTQFKNNICHYANFFLNDGPGDYLDDYCLDTHQVTKIHQHKPHYWDIPKMKIEGIKTLQLLVPVVSTTFASIRKVYPFGSGEKYKENDFNRLIAFDSIGTLIIDEAGQASPFCAVGAIMRAHSVMVVGDPLQIPPVVTNLKKVNEIPVSSEKIKMAYLNPQASVQTFADAINPFGAMQQTGGISSSIWLGCPLVVHRRCLDPMFSISNRISYAGSMINATSIPTKENDEKADYSIRQTYWEHIKGKENKSDCYKHYVEEQGAFIIKKLTGALEKAGDALPSIFVISPFKAVINKLKNELREAGIKSDVSENLIGTVHTFQGKEADEVYILLGCDSSTKPGTFKFVSNNILNVAVSRAKKRLCMVGDKGLWCAMNNYFKIAAEEIDSFQTQEQEIQD